MIKNTWILAFSAFLVALMPFASAQEAGESGEKVLYVYDEVNDNSKPYIGYFRTAFAESGIEFDEATAAEAKSKDLASYRVIVIHGMVMAFNSKSPVRDWLASSPDLKGKKVSLFVTAKQWFLDNLAKDLAGLLKKDGADVVDAVSQATKKMDEPAKIAAVRDQVNRLK
jgi:hypothetical protein